METHISAFGPGKVILLGEHGVVYGQPALAAPISRGVRAIASPSDAVALELPEGLDAAQQEALERAFARAARAARHPRVLVRLESGLPLSMGLGSSGALSVAVARVLLEARHGRPPTLAEVTAVAFEMEKAFHGTPSGVDHTTSARGELTLFRNGRAHRVPAPKPVTVVVALVGARSGTRVTVSALRARQRRWPGRYQRLFREMGALVREGAKAVAAGELEALGDVMNFDHGLLCALGLSSERIDAAVHRLRGLGALGAKLTGAGGDGGAVIGLFDDPSRALSALRRDGVDCFASRLAGPEVRS